MAWAVRDVALLGDRDSYPILTAAWAIKVNEGPLNYRPLERNYCETNLFLYGYDCLYDCTYSQHICSSRDTL